MNNTMSKYIYLTKKLKRKQKLGQYERKMRNTKL